MFDRMYTRLVSSISYKTLIFIPFILSLLALVLITVNPVHLGIDFSGGTLIDISTDDASTEKIDSLTADLQELGLEDLRVYPKKDLVSGQASISISTTTYAELSDVSPILEKYFGTLRESDTAVTTVSAVPQDDLAEKLSMRLRQRVATEYDSESKTLTVYAMDLDRAETESALRFYLGEDVSLVLEKRNLNIGGVAPSLGERLKQDGLTAAIWGYILVSLFVFLAFRDFIPAVAVLLSATFDAVMGLGFMSLFGIVLEPASLVALLMLIGYSVDTDILLTTRVLRRRGGDVNDRIDNAMKTGLTMSGTTILAMFIILVFSNVIIEVPTLSSIAAVLFLGLLADVMSTWFMNAGILKWYVEESGGRFSFKGRKKRR